MIFNCDLFDLGLSGPAFTRYSGSHALPEFHLAHHLVRMKSDHRPLLLQKTANTPPPWVKHFKYFSGWNLHPDFKRFVEANWNSALPITEVIEAFSTVASDWNTNVFGLIGSNKRVILAGLKGVQRCLDQHRTTRMLKVELKLLQKLDTILEHEELMWKHKARIDWINFGERNTSFYHSKAKGCARKRAVQALKVDDDEWCSNHDYLREVAISFFVSLFDVEALSPPVLPLRGQFPSLQTYDLDQLIMIQSSTETKDVLEKNGY
ncbi:hypothetical protein GQ457_02G023050 [Hibiscus cannabinus]